MLIRNAPWVAALTILALLSTSPAWADAAEDALEAEIASIDETMTWVAEEAETLTSDVDREVHNRDQLLLQRRFVTGRDFHFYIEDYRGAAEIFYGIVTHPAAKDMPGLDKAEYFLAESLFQLGYTDNAKVYFEHIQELGKESQYYAHSIVRLLQLAVMENQAAAADRYYRMLVDELPPEQDGTRGMYAYAKYLAERGQRSKAINILQEVPEDGDYFAFSQYLLAVLDVKERKLRPALNRLRRLRTLIDPDETVEYEAVSTQIDLALARIYYEVSDYPQALDAYRSVDPNSEEFGEAMYESLWVLLSRNDFLLLKIQDERNAFDATTREYVEYAEGLELTEDRDSVRPLVKDVDKIGDDMIAMRNMFREIDQYLANLQQDAVENFQNIVDHAPNSPYRPDAELLIAKIYAQAEDFEQSRRVYQDIQSKYSAYYAQIASASNDALSDHTLMGAVAKGVRNPGVVAPQTIPSVPEEVHYWLAADRQVRKVFGIYEKALAEREDVMAIQQLISDIQSELNRLRADPQSVFKETRRRAQQLRATCGEVQGRITAATTNPAIEPDEAARLTAYYPVCTKAVSDVSAIESKLGNRRSSVIAGYQNEYDQLKRPVPTYAPKVEMGFGMASDAAGTVARGALRQVGGRLESYVEKAKVGIVDVDYRATLNAEKRIRQLQKEMGDELRRFRKQYRDSGDEEESSAPPPSDTTMPSMGYDLRVKEPVRGPSDTDDGLELPDGVESVEKPATGDDSSGGATDSGGESSGGEEGTE
ncbi:hypothetical protein KDL45_00580 [bacterium]|nr:hypothetical protein [bacterium]